MENIKELDWDATLFLNDWGSDAIDLFFNIITHKFYAIPLYAFVLFILYRKLGIRNLAIALIAIALLIACSDQLANLFKNSFERLRPFREPALEGLISKVGKSGGTYGFYSGHASSAVAFATFLWFILRRKHKTIGIVMIIWAVLVAYSRVYLGVHYLGDVLMGAFMGTLLGLFFAWVYAFAKARYGVSTTIN
ncbi:phosphatase PAP2 family protein [Nonlabens sp. Ci31]|jgi:undecaprenyl-diphosphatase|uniref:phosphatase PAP2 family protein n=1 Tax=Nonlabens sp. Ci31 TaxID=2608253 RepID=UPI001462C939|nr:phosphatase PAP2 family protein [Nonlabens sp. Ci31]QJP34839.1 phosphatase PAP2 family protein [Nonlabens sp. Ci31]